MENYTGDIVKQTVKWKYRELYRIHCETTPEEEVWRTIQGTLCNNP